ncbi:hypothetical protein [Nocardiopsis sp. YSL2]|uniref:hypothetical protein n=1 Tax=Nocardiopsis sp. YSL2 TaxID=2939492 RepID=UPI0026F43991|nr:hypothetical protein [Nocardiopsis sp. YSL2]
MKKIDRIGGPDGTRVRFVDGPLDDEEFRADVTPDIVYYRPPQEDTATFFKRDDVIRPLRALPVAYTRLGEDADVTIYEFSGAVREVSLTAEEWEARIVDLDSAPPLAHHRRRRGPRSLDAIREEFAPRRSGEPTMAEVDRYMADRTRHDHRQ